LSEAAPSYRERLRIEGAVLAGSGALGSVLLLVLTAQARRWPLNTAGQLALVAALLAVFGPRSTAAALREAGTVSRDAVGSGEPTPLWHIPAVVLALSLLVAEPVLPLPAPLEEAAGWDAALRVTGGCVLVGLAQAVLLERRVAEAEAAEGTTYYRMPGSRLGRGTKLAGVPQN